MNIDYTEQWEQVKGQFLLQAAQLEQRCIATGMNNAEARKLSEELVSLHQQYIDQMAVAHFKGQLLQARGAAENAAKVAMIYGAKGFPKQCEGAGKVAEMQSEIAADLQQELTLIASGATTVGDLMKKYQEELTAAT